MFFADLYATVAFFCVFSFMVFGHNSEVSFSLKYRCVDRESIVYLAAQSFPYSNVCVDQYRVIMEYNAATFITVSLAICLCDLLLRHRLGISLISSGLAVFTNTQMVVPMTITATLAYLLVWGLIVDHARSLLYLTEVFGSLKLSEACKS